MSFDAWQVLGAGAVMAGTTAIGRAQAARFRDRPRDLRRLAGILRALGPDISYARRPLPEALARAGRLTGGGSALAALFADAAKRLEAPGTTAADAFVAAAQKELGRTALTAEDREVLSAFWQTVGSMGAEEQRGQLEATLELLAVREREAAAERVRYEKLWQTMGALAGALIVILFI